MKQLLQKALDKITTWYKHVTRPRCTLCGEDIPKGAGFCCDEHELEYQLRKAW